MAAMRDRQFCFAHDPDKAEARAAARRRGGEAHRRPSAPTPLPEVPGPEQFALGEVESLGDVGAALVTVARALASGQLDSRRGRILTEALRAAGYALESAGPARDPSGAPAGARPATDDEIRYINEHNGELPPGLELHPTTRLLVVDVR